MNRYVLLAALGATLLAAACGTPSKSAANDDDDDKTVVTGSRIPVRNGAAKTSDKSLIDDLNRQTKPQAAQGAKGG
jgi:ABC-type glycerol-3-phosphate transport system substrate-binding protein